MTWAYIAAVACAVTALPAAIIVASRASRNAQADDYRPILRGALVGAGLATAALVLGVLGRVL